MEIKRSGSQPSGKGPKEYFTGTVRIDPLVNAPDPARVAGASVTFEPGARTAWHTHPFGQTLIVLPTSASHSAPKWVIDGPGGIVAALGMILFGLGWLVHRGRANEEERWGCGLLLAGLFGFVTGHAIFGIQRLIERI